ncbi:TonB-dependent outer membrane receptor [Thioploca ingrica]|uniref:TonB-dependent outer membrane receptor n=1 Tax=Thioploca ingrica TaxID=40754 RepID=A0A090AKC4_9GAMM|nr:TonB-dependent outer membrane receptor [Thioploca ingrica]
MGIIQMYERNISLKISVLSAALAAASAGHTEETFQLGRIEVTAKRDLPAVGTDQIEAEVIRDENRETVAKTVDRLPGVSMGNFGARNEQTVFVRGFDMRQVPVFMDGVPVYVPYDGYVDLGRFTTFDLAEVNLSKGFSSVLYGPNTLGGAINLISRRPTQSLEGEAGIGYSSGEEPGSDGERTWLNLGTNQGNWYGQFSGSYLTQDAFALSGDFTPTATENGGLRDNSYRKDRKVSLKAGVTPNTTDEYAVGYINQHGEKGTPPYAGSSKSVTPRYWQWPYWDKESVYAVSKTDLGAGSYVKSRLYYDIFQNSLFSYDDATYTTQKKGYAFQSWYDDHSYGGSVEYGKPIGVHLLKAAAHFKLDHHEEHNAGEPIRTFEDRTTSLALEDTLDLGVGRHMVAGVSHDTRDSLQAEDYNSKTKAITDFPGNSGAAWNPQIGYFTDLGPSDAGRITLSRKTRFPTIKDRYSYRLGSAIPNPDLEPEKATTLETGWVHRFSKQARLDATLFYSDIRDLIQAVDLTASTYQFQNIGKVIAKGMELGIEAWFGEALELGGNYTYLSRDNERSALKLTDVPDQKLFAYATWHVSTPFSLSATTQCEGKRYSSTDGNRVANAFTVFGLRSSYEFGQGWVGRLGIENLTDKEYAFQEGYPEAGRTFYANIDYHF